MFSDIIPIKDHGFNSIRPRYFFHEKLIESLVECVNNKNDVSRKSESDETMFSPSPRGRGSVGYI